MDISLLAVVLAGVASMVLGFVWYGPLFAKAWMREVGLRMEDINAGPGVGYLLTFIAAMVSAAVTSLLVHRLAVVQVGDGLMLGLILGVGYVGTTFMSNYVFARKSMQLYLIDAGYQILNITVAAVIATLVR